LIGRTQAKFKLKNQQGDWEEYSFFFKKGKMTQKNLKSGNIREMRAPMGMIPPAQAMLPTGDMIFITVKPEHVGKDVIEVPNPRKKGEMIKVSLPKKVRAGQKIAIPIPGEGESVDDVAKRQQSHNNAMTTGSKVAVGAGVVAATGAGVVGGVILGDHLAGGTLAEDVADVAVDVADDAGDFALDAADAIGDFAEDVGDWLGDAGEDVGDWICSIFD
jgi:hypothetical protein